MSIFDRDEDLEKEAELAEQMEMEQDPINQFRAQQQFEPAAPMTNEEELQSEIGQLQQDEGITDRDIEMDRLSSILKEPVETYSKEDLEKAKERARYQQIIGALTMFGEGVGRAYGLRGGVDIGKGGVGAGILKSAYDEADQIEDAMSADKKTNYERALESYQKILDAQDRDRTIMREDAADARADRKVGAYEDQVRAMLAKSQKAADKPAALGFEEKEDIKLQKKLELENKKEEKRIKKEDRETNRAMLESRKQLNNKLDQIKNMRKQYEDFLAKKGRFKNSGYNPSGPIMGNLAGYDEESSAMQAIFGDYALDEMGRKFEGMSKAVDSDAERRYFERTQPNMANTETANKMILDTAEEKVKALLQKIDDAQTNYKDSGSFGRPGELPQAPEMVTVRDPNSGRMKKIPRAKLKEALGRGLEEVR